MTWVCARGVDVKLVLQQLNFIQKRDHVGIAKDMISKVESSPTFIRRVITVEVTWAYKYDTPSRHHASEWRTSNESRPKKNTSFSVEKESDAFYELLGHYITTLHGFLPKDQILN